MFTGTPEFFDSRHGVARLAPLHERIVNLRQPQLKLSPFDTGRLRAAALRLRELYPSADPGRLEARVSGAFIERLVAEVTAGGGTGGGGGCAKRRRFGTAGGG